MSTHTRLEDNSDTDLTQSTEKINGILIENGTTILGLSADDAEVTPPLGEDHTDEIEPGGDKGTGYAKHKSLGIVRTWRHWLIGVISFSSFCAVILSYYTVLEYTKNRWLDIEFEKANLTRGNETEITCNINTTGAVYDTESKATKISSLWVTYYSLAGLPSVLSLLILGSYTDVFGRKFFLTIGILGTLICATVTALVIHFEANLEYLLIGKFVQGICGQHGAILQVSLAYTSDITQPGKPRIYGMVAIEITIGIALSLASFVSGFIIEAFGYMAAVLIAAGMSLFNVVFTWILLPETLTKRYRHKGKTCWTTVKTCWKFVVENDSENRRWKYQIVFTILTLCNLAYLGRIPIETLYQLASPFCWSETRVGVYAAIRTLVMMFLGLTSVKILQRWLDEVSLCMLGTLSYSACFYWTAVADDTITLYLSALFTMVGVLEVTSLVVANSMSPAIYSQTVSYMRGLVFLVLGSFSAVSLVFLVILKVGMHIERKQSGLQKDRATEISVDKTD